MFSSIVSCLLPWGSNLEFSTYAKKVTPHEKEKELQKE
jgi:hypothetical protein